VALEMSFYWQRLRKTYDEWRNGCCQSKKTKRSRLLKRRARSARSVITKQLLNNSTKRNGDPDNLSVTGCFSTV
jgi:hypothetical protein